MTDTETLSVPDRPETDADSTSAPEAATKPEPGAEMAAEPSAAEPAPAAMAAAEPIAEGAAPEAEAVTPDVAEASPAEAAATPEAPTTGDEAGAEAGGETAGAETSGEVAAQGAAAAEGAAKGAAKKKGKARRKRRPTPRLREEFVAPTPEELAAIPSDIVRAAIEGGTPVGGKIIGWNQGGFHAVVEGITAFCPKSSMELGAPPHEPAQYLDKEYLFRVLRVEDKGHRLVLSRAAVLREEKKHKAEAMPTQACPRCSSPKLPHRVCPTCGYYRGKKMVEVEDA